MTARRLTDRVSCDLLRTRTRRDARPLDAAIERHFVASARSTEIGGTIVELYRVVSLRR